MDATVLSAHVALCSGDDLESVKELVLHPMDATVASVSSRFSTCFTSNTFGCYCTGFSLPGGIMPSSGFNLTGGIMSSTGFSLPGGTMLKHNHANTMSA